MRINNVQLLKHTWYTEKIGTQKKFQNMLCRKFSKIVLPRKPKNLVLSKLVQKLEDRLFKNV